MCLNYNDLKILPNTLTKQLENVELTGWKKYETYTNQTTGKEYVCARGGNLEIGVWLKADTSKKITTFSTDGRCYKSGFHIFLTRKAARNYDYYGRVYKVKFRKIKIVGLNSTFVDSKNADCVIAEEMYIVPNKKRKTSKKRK